MEVKTKLPALFLLKCHEGMLCAHEDDYYQENNINPNSCRPSPQSQKKSTSVERQCRLREKCHPSLSCSLALNTKQIKHPGCSEWGEKKCPSWISHNSKWNCETIAPAFSFPFSWFTPAAARCWKGSCFFIFFYFLLATLVFGPQISSSHREGILGLICAKSQTRRWHFTCQLLLRVIRR